MAGSRLDKIGTIYSRVQGLLRAGALKDVDKPIWFDVYEAFPPKIEPKYNRILPENKVKNLMVSEDFFRARFNRVYGSPGIIDLNDQKSETISERFVNECFRLYEDGMSETRLFKMVAANLKTVHGIELKTVKQQQQEKQEKMKIEIKAKQDKNMTRGTQRFDEQKFNVSAQDLFGDKRRQPAGSRSPPRSAADLQIDDEDGDFMSEDTNIDSNR
ncbi:small ribosomal subunit protein mS23-like [Tubulanus polymorphus]|uniref:small ribosomal subunit protein mS23-like n=1 Tax=Tubulanus polymorphus TaxID=672921 RepID=UPI003DA33424